MINDSDILSNNLVIKKINHAIKNRIPSSFIRKGDGENIVIGYKFLDEVKLKDFYRMMRIMNISVLNFKFHKFVQKELLQSFNDCNIMGIAKENQRYGYWAIEEDVIKLLKFKSKIFCDMNFHMEFVKYPNEKKIENKLINSILSNKSIGVISCFDVSNFLNQYNTKIKEWIRLPIQRDSFFNKKIDSKFYINVKNKINDNNDVDFWIVAAGIHAKIFCNFIKSNGGIGIDIGSAIDSWKNIYTSRGYLKDIYNND